LQLKIIAALHALKTFLGHIHLLAVSVFPLPLSFPFFCLCLLPSLAHSALTAQTVPVSRRALTMFISGFVPMGLNRYLLIISSLKQITASKTPCNRLYEYYSSHYSLSHICLIYMTFWELSVLTNCIKYTSGDSVEHNIHIINQPVRNLQTVAY